MNILHKATKVIGRGSTMETKKSSRFPSRNSEWRREFINIISVVGRFMVYLRVHP